METLQPKLRFPEFKGELLSKKIGDICNLTTGNKDTQNKIDDGLYPFFVRSQTVEKINSYSYDGEAILTSGDGVGVGKNYHYINGKFDYHQRVYCLNKFKESINGKFVFHYFSENFLKRITRMNAKNSVDSVRREMIFDMPIFIPSLEEQTKIANFLSAVDEKLNLLKEKKALLEDYKKGIMQKIFNQEIRFKDDNGNDFEDWEEKSLWEVSEVNKGNQLNKDDLNDFDIYPSISGGIEPSGYTDKFNRNENTIIISEGGNSCGYVNFIKTKFWCGGHCYSVDVLDDEKFNNEYLFQLLKSNQNEIMALRVGSGLPNIQKKDLKNFRLKFSSNKIEQTKIANFLSAIDEKIELVSTQIEDTQEYKKGLLQQMFV